MIRDELLKRVAELENKVRDLCIKFSKDTGFEIREFSVENYTVISDSAFCKLDKDCNVRAKIKLDIR